MLCVGIESVFSKIGCDNTTITELLGGHAGVTESTMLQYLGLIEQRTNELLQLQVFLQVKVSPNISKSALDIIRIKECVSLFSLN